MSDPHQFVHGDYTVGWICALPETEMVAATAMLDKEHPILPAADAKDKNSYILGEIGNHNVVIACLPSEATGKVSAAYVANDMLRSFPAVRFGLMVGIGGGAPYYGTQQAQEDDSEDDSEADHDDDEIRDIRLGDIVVSQNTKSTEAVVQYDFGKSIQGRGFVHMGGKLDKPPQIVRTGVSALRAKHRLGGNKIRELLEGALANYPGIAEEFQFPTTAKDRLFKSDVVHVDKKKSCKACCGPDNINLVKRNLRKGGDPHIHYGTIGSADDMMKDAILRDKWAPKNGATVENIRSKLDRMEDREILNWITTINFAPQQRDFYQRRQSGTGQWFLDSTEFQEWRKESGKTMFCTGAPGAGKTILTSIAIDSLLQSAGNAGDIGVAYIYCNFRRRDEQCVESLLSSLLRQLAEMRSSLPTEVRMLYSKHSTKRTVPSIEEILATLAAVVMDYSRVFIFIDALDEGPNSEGGLKTLLSETFKLQVKYGANIFATSRDSTEIEKHFGKKKPFPIYAPVHDIATYLEQRMELQDVDIWDKDLRNDVSAKIIAAIDGIRDLAKQALAWIFYARRPILTAELQDALAVKPNTRSLDRDYVPTVSLLSSLCIGLITIDEESRIVRFVHYTTQEYLQINQELWFPYGQSDITETCLTYLSFDAFKSNRLLTKSELDQRLCLNALYEYAIVNWGHHAFETFLQEENSGVNIAGLRTRKASGPDRGSRQGVLRSRILEYLTSETIWSPSSQALSPFGLSVEYTTAKYGELWQMPHKMTSVHLAAWFGLSEIADILIDHRYPFNSRDAWGNTPLSLAAQKGHRRIVEDLLKAGAIVDAEDFHGHTPLAFAAQNGHLAVVDILLRAGASIDYRSSSSMSPFGQAAENGHEKVARYLIESGAEINFENNQADRGLLLMASTKGHAAVVELLLDLGAPIDWIDHSILDQTPLSVAAWEGHETVVNILLDKGAAVEARDSEGHTPLFQAAKRGWESLIKLLINRGAAVNLQDNDGRPALSWAAENGHLASVKALLDMGAATYLKDHEGQTPLDFARGSGQNAVVQLLLEKSTS
ncbi:uncharacterized protein N7496_008545 [Penicillium cataractarum]|uniref:NACHT domain-containing protein n=1 Tax=Penicillium cataractarum TaxID=2100454 RepID=A0A9W9V714_9EURO|nr:uncharacterized protein N7496_008545 [Penicillium cataractarum]KAJ5368785.1 hypothetical protein N7496_008545 [Penicillium cataractarum]